MDTQTLLLVAGAVGLGWLVATWWFQPDHVTFKQTIQSFLGDVLDVFHPLTLQAKRLWAFWGPRLTNRAMLATIFADFAIVASGQDVWTFIGDHPLLAVGVVLMNLLTPLTPVGAPSRLPPPPTSPTGGVVNGHALT